MRDYTKVMAIAMLLLSISHLAMANLELLIIAETPEDFMIWSLMCSRCALM